ncbi:MAG: hypothetical protein K8L97_30350 [Anaerolineae bacterium]|nr:hypothetical protein [Anaerolineae bacterium]
MNRRSTLSKITRRMFRRGQTGQTIVILAFGFIVLLGFVGIVTDVSLLFVRYSTLRRAVDAAAVSAAGQTRRFAPTDEEVTLANSLGGTDLEKQRRAAGYAYARNIATINLSARQFIEFYGLNPSTVLVDSCATLESPVYLPDADPDNPPPPEPDPADPRTPLWKELECDSSLQPRKLVKVTAQVLSPTVFLRLLGWPTVVLEATAISETAVLDVVMIFDTSESMLNQTSYDDWSRIPQPNGTTIDQSMRYYPPRVINGPNSLLSIWGSDYITMYNQIYNMNHDQLMADARVQAQLYRYTVTGATDASAPVAANAPGQPREECRVRFFPGAGTINIPRYPSGSPRPDAYAETDDVWLEMRDFSLVQFAGQNPSPNGRYDGFVPAYNFYGCCNDPDGNMSFEDLICQPMQDVRESTERFLDRVDFNRGDRVAYVTFDRGAYLIDPDGDDDSTHMMTNQTQALAALRSLVGVRAEPNFYADTDANGFWDGFVVNEGGAIINGQGGNYATVWNSVSGTYEATPLLGYDSQPLGGATDFPVKDNCRWINATLPYPYSLYSSPDALTAPSRYPNPLSAYGDPALMHPNLNAADWNAAMPLLSGESDFAKQARKATYAYEFHAGCRGSNVGAGLREANNALLDPLTVRTNGAVWVMVMLGDGAAAGSDPVRRNDNLLFAANPYNDFTLPPLAGDYGAYGVCPYGTAGDRGELTGGPDAFENAAPRCMDENPESRHFCFNPNVKDLAGNIYIDLNNTPECVDKYDVDDFARDWADFIGLTDPFPALVTDDPDRSALQLPTIFTIGFGLKFQQGTGSCEDNINDCLGEELLRYIADVGDNQRVDTDFQQDVRADNLFNKALILDQTYGDRGPCEGPLNPGSVGQIWASADDVPLSEWGEAVVVNPMPPQQNCGNYYNAPSPEQLDVVFDDIASRMFTRLTR